MDKVVDHAKLLGADGIVGVRFNHAATMNRLIVGLHELVLAYGTVSAPSRSTHSLLQALITAQQEMQAVKLEPIDPAVDPFGLARKPHDSPPSSPGCPPAAPHVGQGEAMRSDSDKQFQRLIKRTGLHTE
jgi:hypothetical protein